jgi:transaldolase
MSNPLSLVPGYGQSIWYDYISRRLLDSGDLARLISEDAIAGVTSNPAIFEKAIAESEDYDPAIRALVEGGVDSPVEIYERLAIEDIQRAADVLRPVHEKTEGRDGFVSFEVAPDLAADTQATIAYARRVHAAIDRPNLMIKVPGTPEGMPAIATLVADGISVNVTLLFSVTAYEACALAYMEGLEARVAKGLEVSGVASVASFFVSRIDSLVDKEIEATGDASLQDLRGEIAVANAVVAYERFLSLVESPRWQALAKAGARPQRLLWASTSTKNPAYSKTKYVDDLIAPETVNTIPEDTVAEYRRSGQPGPGLAEGLQEKIAAAHERMSALAAGGISLDRCTGELLVDGVGKFEDAAESLLKSIEHKRNVLRAA